MKGLFFGKNWDETLSTLILHGNPGIEIPRSSYNMITWTQLDLQTRFPWKYCLEFVFLKVSIFGFLLLLHYSNKVISSHPINGFLSVQNWQKAMLVSTCLENQSHIASALTPSTSLQRVIRYFFTLGKRFIPKNHEFCLSHRTWSPDWPNVEKVLWMLN